MDGHNENIGSPSEFRPLPILLVFLRHCEQWPQQLCCTRGKTSYIIHGGYFAYNCKGI